MSETTPRFGLPLLAAGQAQKEIDHNEAVTLLELLAQPVAQTIGDDAPPAAPEPGQCWIVGAAPTGAWAQAADALALWTAGGWRFVPAPIGLWVWIAGLDLWACRAASGWIVGAMSAASLMIGGVQVVGARAPAIPDPSGGDTADGAARAAIAGILAALRNHGLIQS